MGGLTPATSMAAQKVMEMPKVRADRIALQAVEAPTPSASGSGLAWGTDMGTMATARNIVELHFMHNVIYSMATRLFNGQWGR